MRVEFVSSFFFVLFTKSLVAVALAAMLLSWNSVKISKAVLEVWSRAKRSALAALAESMMRAACLPR